MGGLHRVYMAWEVFECNIDMVEWFSQVLERSDVVIDQHKQGEVVAAQSRGQGFTMMLSKQTGCFGLFVHRTSLWITMTYHK